MTQFLLLLMTAGLIWIAIAINETNNILKGIKSIMANINERLALIETRLNEASAEILALIETLRTEQLTDAGRAALDAIEVKANALADIVLPTPAPPPEP